MLDEAQDTNAVLLKVIEEQSSRGSSSATGASSFMPGAERSTR